jgi:hypothetical protein
MFTNEIEFDHTVTTVLDEYADYADVELVIDDAGVFIRQFPEADDKPADLVCMSHKMFKDMIEALNHTEGFFVTKYNKDT